MMFYVFRIKHVSKYIRFYAPNYDFSICKLLGVLFYRTSMLIMLEASLRLISSHKIRQEKYRLKLFIEFIGLWNRLWALQREFPKSKKYQQMKWLHLYFNVYK